MQRSKISYITATLSPCLPRRHREVVKEWLHSFIISALDGTEQLHVPAALSLGKNPGIYLIEGWVGPRTIVDGF
jgi:hypothetical protein